MRSSRKSVVVIGIGLGLLVASLLPTAVAQARSTGHTTPGTVSQVRALVAASIKIKNANAKVLAEAANAGKDNWAGEFKIRPGTACVTATQCVYGDLSGTKTVVLYGDSHARQWLPALNTVAIDQDARLVLLGQDGCPMVSVDFAGSKVYSSSCTATQADAFRVIRSLSPEMVILGDSTFDTGFSRAKWEAGLKATFKAIAPTGAQIVVLQDDTEFTVAPPACISRYPTKIQTECSVDNPNYMMPILTTAERAEANASHVPYIWTQQWLCPASRCSPVVGNFITHFDRGHITASYATYLTGVLAAALRAYFPTLPRSPAVA
jgi:hypothetical protein